MDAAKRRRYQEEFQSQGYCVVRGLFKPADVAQIASAFDRIRGPAFNSVVEANRDEISAKLRDVWTPGGRARANTLSPTGANFSVVPSPTVADPELAIAEPTPDRLSLHLISQCGREESVLAEFGRDPRLLTLAADVLGLAEASQSEMHQIINQAHFKQPGDGVSFACA